MRQKLRSFTIALGALALPCALVAQERPQGAMKERPAPTLPNGATVTATPPTDKENLALNSGFEDANSEGDGPAHWDKTDNLVYHWSRDPDAPDRGRVM